MSQAEIDFPAVAEAWLGTDSIPGVSSDSSQERVWIPAWPSGQPTD
ncbi:MULTISPECIES: hypothetical protein [unclassified Streptomyces]|nr:MULTISPECIES: hypothetical protein [unclassified Streptomyces]